MYAVSDKFHDAVMAGKPTKLRLSFFEGTIETENISSNGLSYSSMAFAEEEVTIGSACSAEIDVTLINHNGIIYNYDFDGTEFIAEIGVLIEGEYEWVPLGVFISEKPDKLKSTLISLTAHDRMVMFDKDADSFLSSLSYPITLKGVFIALCGYVGVPYVDADFPNAGKVFETALIDAQGVTCREVLQWIAEAACSFARINRQGACELKWFAKTGVTFTKTPQRSDYFNIAIAEYSVSRINKLQVSGSETDIGVIVGTGTNGYHIVDNPFLYGYTDAQIRPYAKTIYDRLCAFPSYTPIEMDAVGDWAVDVGDIITVDTGDGDISMPVFRIDLLWNGSPRIQYVNSGAPSRPVMSAENRRKIQAGKVMYEIEQTVNGLKQTVSKTQFLTPVLSDTDPSTEWEEPLNFEGYQWFDGTDTRIWDGEKWLLVINPDFRQTATPTATETGQYWYNPDTEIVKKWNGSAWVEDTTVTIPQTWASSMQTQISVTAEGLLSTVSKDNIISTINQSAEQVKINAGKITLEGVVTANSYFKINADGSMTTTNATITGKITATSGKIGGFDIESNYLSGSNITLRPSVSGGRIDLGAVTLTGLSGLSIDTGMYIGGNTTVDGDLEVYEDLYVGSRLYMESPPSASSSANVRLVSQSNGYYSLGIVSSSKRYKKNIHDIREYDNVSERIDRVPAVTYSPRSGMEKDMNFYGFIAEDMEQEFPWLVEYSKDAEGGIQAESVAYDRTPAILWADAQNTHEILRGLTERIIKLEEKL